MSKEKKDGNWFKRHKILTVILAIVAIGVIASAAGGGGKKSGDTAKNTSSNSSSSDSKSNTVAKIGETARDGKFEFVVKSIKCGESSVTDSSGYLSRSAQGQYCLVDVSVKNIGDKQQIFLESDQKLLNADGVQYSPDSTASVYVNKSNVWLSQINPGNTVEGTLAFDIPKDQTPVSAELHDSSFSNGVKINLQ